MVEMDTVDMDMVEMDMMDMHLVEQSWKPQAQVKRGPGISFSRRKHCKHIASESCVEQDLVKERTPKTDKSFSKKPRH